MSKYIIRPISTGFAIYKGRTIFGRMREIARHGRLWDAEMNMLHLVTQDYHRELDYRRVTNQVMSTDMMEPRADEEHIYTALMLAGKKIPNGGEFEEEYRARVAPIEDDTKKFDHILEPHLGKPITHVARVMFEERLMTWYGQQNPSWIDPRREREYMPAQDRMGRNRYSGGAVAAGMSAPTPVKRWIGELSHRLAMLRRAFFGPSQLSPEDIQRAQGIMDAQNIPQSGRAVQMGSGR